MSTGQNDDPELGQEELAGDLTREQTARECQKDGRHMSQGCRCQLEGVSTDQICDSLTIKIIIRALMNDELLEKNNS